MSSRPSPQLPPPKALLFDIGGVCVISPMRAILDYELSRGIPPGWINHSISRSGPHGTWARAERGETPLDAAFFRGFHKDLTRPTLWRDYCAKAAAVAAAKGLGTGGGDTEAPTLVQTTTVLSAAGADIQDEAISPSTPRPVPDIDAEWLFWEMMRISREPDPHMFPAVRRLKASGRFLVAALSNTTIFPDDHPYNAPPRDPALDVKGTFDVFVSSAHVGLRKPDPRIYELALRIMRERVGRDLSAQDVVFLDDIGENLKQARTLGFRTIKVGLGDTKTAVKELEKVTGMKLLEEEVAKL